MKFLFSILFFSVLFTGFSQRGKNGSVTITATNTIVNLYTPLTANASIGNQTLTVLSSASYSVGDLVFIIQMQGALVNAGKDSILPDLNSSLPKNNTFGAITNYNNSGNNEYAQVYAVPNATTIVIDCGLKYNYNYLSKVQIIKVPRYFTLTISGAGSITCPAWNGSVGGIAVVETQSNCILSSTPSFSVTGKGFRGGAKSNVSGYGGTQFGFLIQGEGSYKGESIAGDSTRYKVYKAVYCRGAMANGGGGGTIHNAGGGGGGNGGNILLYDGYGNPTGYAAAWNLESASFSTHTSSGGGRGGYSFSSSNQNPLTLGIASAAWGGDTRRNNGGFGGRPLDYSTGKLFLAGGGGSGDGGDNRAGVGGSGGGMVYILCYGNLSGAGTIEADGNKGLNTTITCSGNDGAGGGGAGGTIILNVNGTISLSATTALSAKGGDGGNVNFNCTIFTPNTDGYGPGASGGGGYLSVSGVMPTNNINGGLNGIVVGNTSNIAANFPPNGATKGGVGSTGSILNYSLTASANQTLCTNQNFTLTATSTLPGNTISWYNSIVGGTSIATGTAYVSSGYPSAGTYTLYAGVCPGTYRQPIIITVNAGLILSINSPTICAGQTTTLIAAGATTYTWNTGPTTASITVSPLATTIYTLSGLSGLCAGTKTTQVTVNSVPTVTVTNQTICSGNSVTLTAGGASTYSWSTGALTNTILISPSSTTSYSVTGTLSLCSNTAISTVSVVATPTISLASQTICAGQTATFTGVGATSYTWLPGSSTGTTFTIAPITTTVITIKGANGTCTAQATATLTIGSGITIAVNSPTICSGQTATLTASGATTYSWSSGSTSGTITINPTTTTIYTITGSSGICLGATTATVTVKPIPIIAFVSPTICSCSQPTLNLSGVTSVTVFPVPLSIIGGTTIVCGSICSNTNYTVTGSNGSCLTTSIIPVIVTPTPTLTVNSPTICLGQTATLTVSGASTYLWSNGATTSNINLTPLTNTNYTVTGINGICSSTAISSVSVNTVTLTNFSLTIPLCANQITLLNAGVSSATSFTWSNGPNTYTQNVSPSATTTYSVLGNNGACPALVGVITLSVNSVIADFVGINGPFVTQGSILNLLNTSIGAVNYNWEFCDITNSILTNQTFLAQDTGYCCVKLIANNVSCKDSITKCFNIISEAVVIIPNVFTPNGDSKNDLFTIKTIGVKSLNCIIFDRWGLKLYDWDVINGSWDGNTKNGPAHDGSYFFILEYNDYKDKTTKVKGCFQLFKN
jgi:gliding motility-associated-like protein